jgi:hypothetical protein
MARNVEQARAILDELERLLPVDSRLELCRSGKDNDLVKAVVHALAELHNTMIEARDALAKEEN